MSLEAVGEHEILTSSGSAADLDTLEVPDLLTDEPRNEGLNSERTRGKVRNSTSTGTNVSKRTYSEVLRLGRKAATAALPRTKVFG